MSQKVQKEKALIRKEIRRAMKKIDRKVINFKLGDAALVAFSSFSYDSGVGILNIANNITQGAALNQRVGNDIRLNKLSGCLAIAPGDNFNVVRVLVIASKGTQTSSTTSTFTSQVFSGITGAAQVTAPVDALSFDVLFDRKIVPFYRPLDGSTATTIGVPEIVNLDVPLGAREVHYNQGNSANTGRPVWLLLVSDSAAVAHAGCVQAGLKVDFQSGE